MKSHRLRWFSGLLCLSLIMTLAMTAGVNPTLAHGPGQKPLPAGPWWLSFDGSPEPVAPTLTLRNADASAIDLAAHTPGCLVETITAEGQTYSRLWGTGYGFASALGRPDLPVLRRDIEIPFGAEVTLELGPAQYADYALTDRGLAPIYPVQPPAPKTPAAPAAPLVKDQDFYAHGARYPQAPVSLGASYIVRGHRVQTVEVWPVAYDPSAGTVRLYSALTVRLRLTGSDLARTQALAERYASPAFDARLGRDLLNYNQGRPAARPDSLTVNEGYLIITADAYYAAMQPFVTLKQGQGLDVTITRLSDIPASTNTQIKAYIQTAYDTWPTPPSYVLLVGDTDTVPGWNSVSAGEITDLYYGCMDGSSDWHPDIGRGRFPVRSAAQATIMVNKYLAYANLMGTEPWLKKVAFLATCDQYTVAEGTHNYVITNHTAPNDYAGSFPNNPQPGGDKLYCITYNADGADIQAAVNAGRWAVIYSGHGGWDGWEMDYGQTQVRNLTSTGMFPFVASHACVTGDFDQLEVYGETWVLQDNKGALAFWGSSDSSFWDEDDVLERVMFDSLFTDAKSFPNVATMTDAGLAAVEAAYSGSARYYWETYNVLGDPAVKIFREPDQPTFSLTVDPTAHELCASGAVTSTVTIQSVRGYTGTVDLDAGALPAGITATFVPASAPAPFASELTLTVAPGVPGGDYAIVVTATDHGANTFDQTIDLHVAAGAPAAPALATPADGAANQPLQPTFTWAADATARSYRFQLADNPRFDAPLVDQSGLTSAIYTLDAPLSGNRCYWWRVQAENICGNGAWSSARHLSTVALSASLYDDMESGAGQWTHQAAQGIDNWALSTDQSHSPSHAWLVPDDSAITDSRLWNTTPVALGPGSTLTFWHRHSFEGSSTRYDGSVLEISTDGDVWTDLGAHITANGYNGTLSASYGNPLGGRQAWTGDLTTWTQVTVDLSSYAGSTAQIRWRIGCDSSVSDTGWFIDDIQVTAPLPPSPAPVVDSVTPNVGSAYEDTTVQIAGANFLATPNVQLGDTWLLSVTLTSSALLEAVAPAGLPAGTYTLTLYNGDCQATTLPDAFTAVTTCVSPAIAIASDSPVIVGEPVHLTAHRLAGTPPLTYTWAIAGLGQGSGLDTATPVYTFTAPGTYAVTATVTNDCGRAVATGTVDVLCRPLVVDLGSSSPALVGHALALTATVAGDGPLAYAWDPGGPGSGVGLDTATPIYTYTAPGAYTVTVTVQDACSNQQQASGPVLIGAAAITPTSPISGTVAPDAALVVNFDEAVNALTIQFAFSPTVNLSVTWHSTKGLGHDQAIITHDLLTPGQTYEFSVLPGGQTQAGGAVNAHTWTLEVPPATRYYLYLPLVLRED